MVMIDKQAHLRKIREQSRQRGDKNNNGGKLNEVHTGTSKGKIPRG